MDSILHTLPIVLACVFIFGVGGLFKGIVSLGLPLILLPLLLLVVDIRTAVALMMVPLIVSNLVQAIEGEGFAAIVKRFWAPLVLIAAGTIVGTILFAKLDQHILQLSIGILAILFATASLVQPGLSISAASERWLGPLVSLVSGVIGGMSTFFGPILTIYLVGLHLPRDTFVKTIALFYFVASMALLIGGASQGTTDIVLVAASALAMIPTYAGMIIGRSVRQRIDPDRFRNLVLVVVWVSGANMIRLGLGH
jgi:uncharacterized membrane protein YfcA